MIRRGSEISMSTYELLVGDVLVLATGDILPADGLLLQGSDLRWVDSSISHLALCFGIFPRL